MGAEQETVSHILLNCIPLELCISQGRVSGTLAVRLAQSNQPNATGAIFVHYGDTI